MTTKEAPKYTLIQNGQKGQPGYTEGLFGTSVFYEGALFEVNTGLQFYPGTWQGLHFVPGISVPTIAGWTFLPGMYYEDRFVPGVAISPIFGYGSEVFLPGLVTGTRGKPGQAILSSIQSYLPSGIRGSMEYSAKQGATIFITGVYDGHQRFKPGLPSDYRSRYGTITTGGFPMQKVGNRLSQASLGGSGFNCVIPGKGSPEASFAGTQVRCSEPPLNYDPVTSFAEGCTIGSAAGGGGVLGIIGCIIYGAVDVFFRESSESNTIECDARQTNQEGKVTKQTTFEVTEPNEVCINSDGSIEVTDKEQGDFTQTVMEANPDNLQTDQTDPITTSDQEPIVFPPLDLTDEGIPSDVEIDVVIPAWLMAFLSDWSLAPSAPTLDNPDFGVIDPGFEGSRSGTTFKWRVRGDIDPKDFTESGRGTSKPLSQPGRGVIDYPEGHGALSDIGRIRSSTGGQGGMSSSIEYEHYLRSKIIAEVRASGQYTLEAEERLIEERCRAAGIRPPERKTWNER